MRGRASACALVVAMVGGCSSDSSNSDEVDPIFGASAAAGISNGEVDSWNAAAAWGDHHAAGYLTSEADPKIGDTTSGNWCVGDGTKVSCTEAPPITAEVDPTFAASAAAGITSNDTANWDTAVSWGDHAAAGYLTAEADPRVGATTPGAWCVGTGAQVNCNQTAPADTNAATLCPDGQYLNGDGNCYPVRPMRVAGVLTPGQTVRFNNQFDVGVTIDVFFGHLNSGGQFTELRGAGQNGNSYISGFAFTSGAPATVESVILTTGAQTFVLTKPHGRIRGGNDGTGPTAGSFVLENNDTTNINYVAYIGPTDLHPY